ncbi:MAG: FKBP-type peptidyl-prolyl cis-trans isomerase [Pirellulales bacterium]
MTRHLALMQRKLQDLCCISFLLAGCIVMASEPEAIPSPADISGSGSKQKTSNIARLDQPQSILGYAVGVRIGSEIAEDFRTRYPDIPLEAIARGLFDSTGGAALALSDSEIQKALEYFDALAREKNEEFEKKMVEIAQKNLLDAVDFLEKNSKKPGVVTRPSGLQYEILKAGTGPHPSPSSEVALRYRGTLIDGSEFDATDSQAEPVTYHVVAMAPGWREAMPLMRVGSRWRLFVPPELGYGARGFPPLVEPNEVLVFDIELVGIVPSR